MSPSQSSSLEDLRSALNQASPELSEADGENDQAHGEVADMAIADAAREIARRREIAGAGYPFSFDGTILSAYQNWTGDAGAYVFLLLLSAHDLPGMQNGRRLFEVVVTDALAEYASGDSLRFGFPHRDPVPSHPNDAVDYLARLLGQPRLHTRKVRYREKDMGVDAVAWRPFGDARATKLILLGNCSTGATWSSKLGEPSLEKWRRMIDFGCEPIRVFAVPWIPSSEDWADIVDYGYLVLDRLRIAKLLKGRQQPDVIDRWCQRRLKEARRAALATT